jgi:putative phosphoserine phosphatase/1-acylglycerol-3-phosphate O-acyltransferase
MLYHPGTVEVEVLPPVETDGWSAETIDQHVTDVRNMYLRALEQDAESRKRAAAPVVLTDVSAGGSRE